MRKGVKVRRVIRRFELWTVAKVALFFHLFCYLLTLAVFTGCWTIMDRVGTLKNLEQLAENVGWDEFSIKGNVFFRAFATIGGSFVLVNTIATVALAFLYNMLSGILGGLVVSVLQEASDSVPVSRREQRRLDKEAKKAEPKKRRKGDAQPSELNGAALPSPPVVSDRTAAASTMPNVPTPGGLWGSGDET